MPARSRSMRCRTLASCWSDDAAAVKAGAGGVGRAADAQCAFDSNEEDEEEEEEDESEEAGGAGPTAAPRAPGAAAWPSAAATKTEEEPSTESCEKKR